MGGRAERLFHAVQPRLHAEGLHQDAGYPPIAAAEIVAVVAGRKPLFHEQLTPGCVAWLARGLRSILPTEIKVASRDGHLMIFEPSAIRLLLDQDRAFYRPAGEDDLAALHRAVVAGDCGELLGYGARRLFLPGAVPVFLFCGDRLIAGFHAPAEKAGDFARERALDYAFYLNQPVRYSIS